MKKIDINKYKVFKQRDGSITYARLHKASHIGGSEPFQGGLSYNKYGVDVPAQWRSLDPKRHHKIVGELKKLVKEGKLKAEPVTGNWEDIGFQKDNLKSLTLTRWACDGSWANIIPERYYQTVQELKRLFWIGLFCIIVLVGSLA